jgi:FKBP-type peptidyl-prolyl cis-trans isomerase FklB
MAKRWIMIVSIGLLIAVGGARSNSTLRNPACAHCTAPMIEAMNSQCGSCIEADAEPEGQSDPAKQQADAESALAEKNKKDGEAFLAANKSKEGVVALPSGLQYKILTAGNGIKPAAEDTVVCNYRGTLIDGTEFDSSYKRNQPSSFGVSKVIKGWTEALQLMPVGSKWQLFIPASLAYGERRRSNIISPNSTLIFEVELLSIQGKH